MIIVAGYIKVQRGKRDTFLKESASAILAARKASGCRDFAVSADLLDTNRVNVYEEWESSEQLKAFRESGPSNSLMELIVEAKVKEYSVQ